MGSKFGDELSLFGQVWHLMLIGKNFVDFLHMKKKKNKRQGNLLLEKKIEKEKKRGKVNCFFKKKERKRIEKD